MSLPLDQAMPEENGVTGKNHAIISMKFFLFFAFFALVIFLLQDFEWFKQLFGKDHETIKEIVKRLEKGRSAISFMPFVYIDAVQYALNWLMILPLAYAGGALLFSRFRTGLLLNSIATLMFGVLCLYCMQEYVYSGDEVAAAWVLPLTVSGLLNGRDLWTFVPYTIPFSAGLLAAMWVWKR